MNGNRISKKKQMKLALKKKNFKQYGAHLWCMICQRSTTQHVLGL